MKYVAGLFLILFSLQVVAKDRIYQGKRTGAIRGYDPVSYFVDNEAKRGSKEITYRYLDATWRFSSEKNKELFIENPEKYIPQYGGYCAKAMAGDRLLKVDPKAWTIIDDKLYLNYSSRTRATWRKEKLGLIDKADQYWESHMAENYAEEIKAAIPAQKKRAILDSVDEVEAGRVN